MRFLRWQPTPALLPLRLRQIHNPSVLVVNDEPLRTDCIHADQRLSLLTWLVEVLTNYLLISSLS